MQRRTALLVALAALVLAAYLLFRPATLPPGLIPEDGAYDARILRDTWGGRRGGVAGEMRTRA